MVMRVWPAKVKIEVTRLLDQDVKVPGDAVIHQEQYVVNVEGLCADAVLRKIKDHYKAIDKNCDVKFLSAVEWYPADQIGKVALSF